MNEEAGEEAQVEPRRASLQQFVALEQGTQRRAHEMHVATQRSALPAFAKPRESLHRDFEIGAVVFAHGEEMARAFRAHRLKGMVLGRISCLHERSIFPAKLCVVLIRARIQYHHPPGQLPEGQREIQPFSAQAADDHMAAPTAQAKAPSLLAEELHPDFCQRGKGDNGSGQPCCLEWPRHGQVMGPGPIHPEK